MNLVFDDGQVRLYCGDVRDFDPPAEWAAAVVSSPPYNVGVDYADGSDRMEWGAYWAMAETVAISCWRALVPSGRLFWNTAVSVPADPTGEASGPKRRVPLAYRWAAAFERVGFGLIDTIAWTSMRGAGSAWGSWENPSAPNLRGDWEAIQVACKLGWERTPPADAPPGWRDKEGGWQHLVTNVWRVAPAARDGHPAPFPAEVAQRCIRLGSWPGETIFDPFAGSGTTLLAAKGLGRRAVGVERSELYCERAAARLAEGRLVFR